MRSDRDFIQLHQLRHAISRREFLGATAGAAGLMATSAAWFPTLAWAEGAGGHTSGLPMTPRPVVIPGGDVLGPPAFPPFQIHQFAPGDPALGLDGIDAEPNGITNFRGLVAMGYTTGKATDHIGKTYNSITDNRLYVGEYMAMDGRRAHGTFVEIWIDLYDPGSGSALHDFSPGILPDGLFWLAKIRNNSVKRVGNQTVRLRVADLPEIDTFTFYNPVPPTLPGVPSVTSFEQTWTKSGSPRQINPTSADPISAFNWAGRMWKATSSIRFTVAYADGSFSAQGTGSSSATDFGEMGFERNGVFLQDDSGGQGENQAIE